MLHLLNIIFLKALEKFKKYILNGKKLNKFEKIYKKQKN